MSSMDKKNILEETKYLFLSSSNRSSGNNSKFTVYLPSSLITINNNKQKILKVSMYDITLTYDWFNVQSSNNSLTYFNGTTTTTITIPVGNYSVFQLKDALNGLLSTYTVTYNELRNNFTFTTTNATDSITPTTSGLLLGLINATTYTGTFTSVFPAKMSIYNTLYLNTDLNNTNTNLDNLGQQTVNTSTVLDSVPVNVSPYDTLYYESINPSSFNVSVTSNHLNSITLFLTTNTGENLITNTPWNVTLQLEIYTKEV